MRRPWLFAVLPLGALLSCSTPATTAAISSAPTSTTAGSSALPTRTLTATPTLAATPGTPTLPAFHSAVATVTAADLPSSYRAGCPTPPSQLRMLTLTYVDFAGHAQSGHLVVNAGHAAQVVAIFADLYAHRFPIRTMVPVDAYGGNDDRSVAADNTAGFNCRAAVASGPTSWSMHAYGEAIDVDPVENPYIESDGVVDPPAGKAYVNRHDIRPGMAVDGGELVEAFARQGWTWGVTFGDYQHFSTNGK